MASANDAPVAASFMIEPVAESAPRTSKAPKDDGSAQRSCTWRASTSGVTEDTGESCFISPTTTAFLARLSTGTPSSGAACPASSIINKSRNANSGLRPSPSNRGALCKVATMHGNSMAACLSAFLRLPGSGVAITLASQRVSQ